MIPTLLGGMTAKEFLRDYWQKKPLLIRGAVPGFGDWLNRDSTLALACHDEAEARLIANDNDDWEVRNAAPLSPETSNAARTCGRYWCRA